MISMQSIAMQQERPGMKPGRDASSLRLSPEKGQQSLIRKGGLVRQAGER